MSNPEKRASDSPVRAVPGRNVELGAASSDIEESKIDDNVVINMEQKKLKPQIFLPGEETQTFNLRQMFIENEITEAIYFKTLIAFFIIGMGLLVCGLIEKFKYLWGVFLIETLEISIVVMLGVLATKFSSSDAKSELLLTLHILGMAFLVGIGLDNFFTRCVIDIGRRVETRLFGLLHFPLSILCFATGLLGIKALKHIKHRETVIENIDSNPMAEQVAPNPLSTSIEGGSLEDLDSTPKHFEGDNQGIQTQPDSMEMTGSNPSLTALGIANPTVPGINPMQIASLGFESVTFEQIYLLMLIMGITTSMLLIFVLHLGGGWTPAFNVQMGYFLTATFVGLSYYVIKRRAVLEIQVLMLTFFVGIYLHNILLYNWTNEMELTNKAELTWTNFGMGLFSGVMCYAGRKLVKSIKQGRQDVSYLVFEDEDAEEGESDWPF